RAAGSRHREGEQGANRPIRRRGGGSLAGIPPRALRPPAAPRQSWRRGASLRERPRGPPDDAFDGAPLEEPPASRRPPDRPLAAPASPPLRHASPFRGSGPARDPGASRPRLPLDDAEVHASRRGPPARRLPPRPPEGLKQDFGMRISNFGFALALAALGAGGAGNPPASPPQSVLSEIARYCRRGFL